MPDNSLPNTERKSNFNQKTNSDKFKVKPKKQSTTYENMCILRRDLYYKDIVNAHSIRIERETENQIKDIMYRYKKNWIPKKELFDEIESLKSGYPCTDIPVKNIIKQIRAKV